MSSPQSLQSLFEQLIVIETATILAGPSVGMFFAELGATVIKVENRRTAGDTTRLWRLPSENPNNDISAYFSSVNWGKRSLALDLAEPAELNILHQLLRRADIFLHNFRPAVRERLGVGFEQLRATNPRLICGGIVAYTADSDRPGLDAIMQAESGYMAMNGQPDGPPTKMPVALIDVLAAHQLKEGVLLALLERQITGRGSEVSASLFQSAVASLVNQATNYLVADHIPGRMGSDHPNISPYGAVYTTADGKEVLLAIANDRQFAQLVDILGAAELAIDPRFQTNSQRVVHNEPLKAILAQKIGQIERKRLLELCEAQVVPVGAVNQMDEVFDQPAARPLLQEARLADQQTIRGVRTIAFEPPAGLVKRSLDPPPHLDQHRAEILAWLKPFH